jgi:uncharacterized surface protein with fasciclin (FAS1) repeats
MHPLDKQNRHLSEHFTNQIGLQITLATLAGFAVAQDTQNLNATLSGNEQLSNLTTFLGLAPDLLQALSNATNITILAPSNEAFANFANSSLAADVTADPGLLAAVLQYHVLNGTYTASQITNQSAFLPTMLQNSSYANVTGGQVVEAVMIGNETVFYSGLLQNSTVTSAVSYYQAAFSLSWQFVRRLHDASVMLHTVFTLAGHD